ncbi:MAG: PDZ domain-containing protein [Planctomycetales bacterium]|nr:PDZ domain-containing protein [Planctomycetales bacterium]
MSDHARLLVDRQLGGAEAGALAEQRLLNARGAEPSATAASDAVRFLGLFTRLIAVIALVSLAVGLTGSTHGQDGDDRPERSHGERADEGTRDMPFGADRFFVPRWRLTNGPQVRAAFREVVEGAVPSTVKVKVDQHDEALGAVVGVEGWILTKASVLRGEIACRFADGRELPATIAGVDKEFDLALLKVDANDLVPLNFSPELPEVGAWVATVGLWRDPLAVGVVSVPPRALPHQSGVLGVQLDESDKPLVTRVFPDTGAADAGVLVNDMIVKVNGQATPSRLALIRRVRTFSPGDQIELEILRDGETITVTATLMSESTALPLGNRSAMQNMMGGALSERRFGFPRALQHDTVLRPSECGGPLVNLDGEAVGLNIARSGRTESYAIDGATVADVAARLMAAAGAAPTAPPVRPMTTAAPIVD